MVSFKTHASQAYVTIGLKILQYSFSFAKYLITFNKFVLPHICSHLTLHFILFSQRNTNALQRIHMHDDKPLIISAALTVTS